MSLSSSDSRTWNLIEKFQLGDLDDSYMPVIRQLADDVAAQNLLTTNTNLFGTGPQAMTAAALSAIVKQNFIIISQLSHIEDLLRNSQQKTP